MQLLLLIALPIIFTYLLLTHSKPKNPRLPPGPPRFPVIGNLHQFISAKNLPFYLWKLSLKYGKIIHLKLGFANVVVVSSPKLAEEVLKTQDLSFCSRPQLLGQKKLSYNCKDVVYSPYGEYWREMRKITTTHIFSIKKTQSFRSIREEEVGRLISKISSDSGRVVNLSEMAMALGSGLICRIAFGKKMEEDGSEMRRFDGLLHNAQAALGKFFVSDFFPGFGWVDRVVGNLKWLDSTFEKLELFYRELIDEHLDPKRVEKEAEEEKEEDILDLFIRLKEEKSCSIELDWDHIKALLMNIFIAATDTSAAMTTWTMMALMKADNAIKKKVQQEIRNLVGRKGKVDGDDLPQLPYLKAVINETLRLYPAAPLLIPRETMERCSLGGYEISPKTVVYVNAWAVARDPEYWKNLVEFMPERFINSNIDIRGRDFGLLPFGSGRRICPGINLIPRETMERCSLGGYEISPKTVVYVNAWAVARDPEYWKNLVEFMPERFINSNIDIRGRDFGLLPFGSGRRICPGINMGLASVELTIANLLYSFDWDLPLGIRAEDIDTDILPGVTMHKKNPLLLIPRKYVF